ncbi:MAG: hypothetical protein KGZ85_10595 [Ignavibacterium sp.]|nr:hypothetical protein [Ignavibacterium sp.]
MKIILLQLIVISIFLYSCSEKNDKSRMENDFSEDVTTEQHTVLVKERLDASDYSYLNVDETGKEYWIAIPQSEISAGDEISFSRYMEMKDFRSDKLDRTFESLLFVEDARRKGDAHLPNPHQTELGAITKEDLQIAKAKEGFTIEELFTRKNELSEKLVLVRGKVVKANLGIMNRNWFHIQDGTGEEGKHDLTITSNDAAKIGDIILVEGKLVKDKDFGSGYVYSLLLEDSKIKVE